MVPSRHLPFFVCGSVVQRTLSPRSASFTCTSSQSSVFLSKQRPIVSS